MKKNLLTINLNARSDVEYRVSSQRIVAQITNGALSFSLQWSSRETHSIELGKLFLRQNDCQRSLHLAVKQCISCVSWRASRYRNQTQCERIICFRARDTVRHCWSRKHAYNFSFSSRFLFNVSSAKQWLNHVRDFDWHHEHRCMINHCRFHLHGPHCDLAIDGDNLLLKRHIRKKRKTLCKWFFKEREHFYQVTWEKFKVLMVER